MRNKIQKDSLRTFIILWMSGIAFCLILMTVTLIISTNKLQSMTARLLFDSKAIEACHQFEEAILSERREDLLWRTTGEEIHRTAKEKEFETAAYVIQQLQDYLTSDEERAIAENVEKNFEEYSRLIKAPEEQDINVVSLISDTLLQSIDNYREQNRTQMLNTLDASMNLDVLVDIISIGFIVIVSMIVVSGSILLTKRIFIPTFALIRTVKKFGQGDFGVQAHVYRNDELGLLSATFNDMAKNIHDLQQERMNFVTSTAHDLKNPIVMIGMAAHRLKKKLDIAKNEAFWLDNIIEQTDFLESMINDLMDTMQVEFGNFTLNFSEIEMGAFIGTIQRNQNKIITTHEIVLGSASECRVSCDAKRIERVISNLISNAVKYSPEKTSVFLNVSTKDEWGIISVRDEGVGIEKHEIDSIFKPFSRLIRTSGIAKGFGMGLFSVKKIVDGHGGFIEVESEIGLGTTFEIWLPLIGRDV